jgi:hypothetical protein
MLMTPKVTAPSPANPKLKLKITTTTIAILYSQPSALHTNLRTAAT